MQFHRNGVGGVIGHGVHSWQTYMLLYREEALRTKCDWAQQPLSQPRYDDRREWQIYKMGFGVHSSTCAITAFSSWSSESDSWVPLGMLSFGCMFFLNRSYTFLFLCVSMILCCKLDNLCNSEAALGSGSSSLPRCAATAVLCLFSIKLKLSVMYDC